MPDRVAIAGRELPEDVFTLFKALGAASLGYWHFCSFQDSVSIRSLLMSLRNDDVGLDMVEEAAVSPQIRPFYWSEFWVPLFAIEHYLICVDLDPAEAGVAGQVIRVSDDSQERRWVCSSLDEFCGLIVERYERGRSAFRDFGAGPELHEIGDSLEFLWGQSQESARDGVPENP